MSDQKKRPTGIHIENCENITLTNNTGMGDMDFIVAKNSKNIIGAGNQHTIPNQETASHEKRWFEKPFGIVFLAVAGIVIGGSIIYYLDWN